MEIFKNAIPDVMRIVFVGIITGSFFQIIIFYLGGTIRNNYMYEFVLDEYDNKAIHRHGFLFLKKAEARVDKQNINKYILITENAIEEMDSSSDMTSARSLILFLISLCGAAIGSFSLIEGGTFLLGFVSIGIFFFALSSMLIAIILRSITLNTLRRDLLELKLLESEM